uniref:KAP NTPase domain-containing protein n=1 Tax=Panagrellus redivivus TaxID=6233 RepID=A0A7E4UPU9_PANRE
MLPLQEIDSSPALGALAGDEAMSPQIEEYFQQLEAGILPSFTGLSSVEIASKRNDTGETFLIVAAKSGRADNIPPLLVDAEIDETDNEGWSALLNACHLGHTDVVKLLLEAGASVDQADLMGWTPILWATYKNRLAIVELLLEYKAHANIVGEEDGLTPLIVAAGRGYGDIVRKLLEKDVHVNACDKFGSTALIWAARKGFLHIIEDLLNAGVELDAVGMYSSTALMLATRGNYIKVVEAMLAREPNVNVVDYNGLSALGIAAREGYAEIAQALVQSGAFVNLVDRFGNSILASAVRSGNINIVRMLLDKYADVNSRDSENRTPLHLAIDKSYMDIVLALLEKKPNLELKNKEGETALLRAVKNRDVALCQLLVSSGAKISATDNAGDNPLHLALRARSTRLTQTLLVNPSDSKLLYRPNKLGETPYSIDQDNPNPILPSIFGPIGSDVDLKNMLGYDAYSDVLADIVCEPNLTLPLMIGLFAKWGSGKSLLLPKIRESMRSFSRSWLDGVELYWSWSVIFALLFACTFVTLLFATIISIIVPDFTVFYAIVGGVIVFITLLGIYVFIYYGSEVKLWNGSISTARIIAQNLARLRLVFSIMTLNAPVRTDKDLVVSPVSFLFADDHRLSFIGGEHALTSIVQSLYEAVELHYGSLAVRLFSAFKTSTSNYRDSRLRTLCGVPVVGYAVIILLSFGMGMILLTIHFKTLDDLNSTASYLVAAIVCFTIFCISAAFPTYVMFFRIFLDSPVRRVKNITRRVHTIPFERMIQKLQKEVDLLVSLVHCLDAFTNSQTRLVIMVDGLDSCEQNKMVHIFDSLILFFASRQNLPFIVILAVDPHIIINAINHKAFGTSGSTEITGHDYMKNNINMPFFLHHAAIKQLQSTLRQRCESMSEWKERNLGRSDTFRESRISLREHSSGNNHVDAGFVANNGFLPTEGDFSNMNPRTVRRIVNSMALTGRLLRTFEVDFAWSSLYYWIALVEQWPYRMCWLMDKAQEIADDYITVAELYHMVKGQLPTKNVLIELDRNPKEFEQFLRRMASHKANQLTVSQMRKLAACTSNLDPYLRKLMKDQRSAEAGLNGGDDADPLGAFQPIGAAEYLFEDPSTWDSVVKPLAKMSIDELVALVGQLNVPQERLTEILPMFYLFNLNGLVLQSCDLDELHRTLKVNLGDWTLIRLLIETLRKWRLPPTSPSPTQLRPASSSRAGRTNSISRQTNGFTEPPIITINPDASHSKTRMNSIVEEAHHNGSDDSFIHLQDASHPDGVDIDLLNSDRESDTNSAKSVAGSRESLLHSE